eukprot:TRINITY_DN58579_c0_g1_i1.p1 TRINITY_DN58579_c0_g1~~TRINITY_DN58579_c0_g1_i1.p1  ORF type:complete len:274 (+),score=55.32 TRINITY_DN58579_c0_g1_i1:68-889(+)
MSMNGPSAQALRDGGTGGSLRYKNGYTIMLRLAGGGPLPMEWRRKTTIQGQFSEFGQILKIEIPEGQGVVYVEFDDKRDAEEAASEMNNKRMKGETVQVSIVSSLAPIAGVVASVGPSGGDLTSKVTEMAREHRLDETATTRLISVFGERVRLGCDLVRDLNELSIHLSASSRPSALVSMKLAELRLGQPIGPCKYSRGERPPGKDADRGLRVGPGRIEEREERRQDSAGLEKTAERSRSRRRGERSRSRRGRQTEGKGGQDRDKGRERRRRD